MDPAIERFTVVGSNGASCTDSAGLGTYNDSTSNLDRLEAATGARWCSPDNLKFKKLISQWAFAFAPTAMHSARTTGFGGFHLSLEGDYTKISNGADYWKEGTRGPVDPTSKKASIVNDDPQSLLQLYSVKLRKSFGFGLELTGVVGFMPKTRLFSGGADVRLSLLEGFRSGIPGVLPDIAAGGGVRTITGTPEFQLTVASVDAQISKPLPIADSSILTPWVGFQYLWIFGDSGLVDLTPGTDATQYCNYAGINSPGNADSKKTATDPQTKQKVNIYDGQPVCNGGSPLDFNNNVVFDKVRLERQRLLFGLSYRYETFMMGGEFLFDLVDPGSAQTNAQDKKDLAGEARQWTLALEIGAMF